MNAENNDITPHHSSNRRFIYKHRTKCDLYNHLLEDGLETCDELLRNVRKGDTNALLKVAYAYDEQAINCHRKSLEWALLAAVKECPEAQLKVASMLHSCPPGIKKDDNIAMEWYLQAAKNGSSEAVSSIESVYKHVHNFEHGDATTKSQFLRAVSSMNRTGDDQKHGVTRETLLNIKNSAANLRAYQQDICNMEATMSQSQAAFENAVEKLSELEHFFKTKIQEIEQRESELNRNRSRASGNDNENDDKYISKKRCKHKKFSCRWMKRFPLHPC